MVDDNIGYFDHEDRVSGQIYQIPGWDYSRRTGPQSDRELATLSSVIQAIVEKGSIQKYLFSRVYSVFRHEYNGQRLRHSIQLRKQMVNILVDAIGMDLDEDTVVSAMWILDNILKFCGEAPVGSSPRRDDKHDKFDKRHKEQQQAQRGTSLGEYL